MGTPWTLPTPSRVKPVESVQGNLLTVIAPYPQTRDMNTTPTAVRTGSGTIHAFTIGLTYTFRGDRMTNVATSTSGKADCGALTSAAARFTAEAINCTKCATSA